jgi:hypothetical protein
LSYETALFAFKPKRFHFIRYGRRFRSSGEEGQDENSLKPMSRIETMNYPNGDSSPSPLKGERVGVRGAKVPSQQQIRGDGER